MATPLETIRLIWSRFGEAQVNLFAFHESSLRQLYFSLTKGPLGTDALAHSWPQDLRKYVFPPVSLLAQTLCKLREDEEQVLLVTPLWLTRTWFPELIFLATAPLWRIPLRKDLLSQRLGTIWHPCPDLCNLHVWLLDGTWQTWAVYHRQWKRPSLRLELLQQGKPTPLRSGVCSRTGVLLAEKTPEDARLGSFLQERLERRLSPSTLKCM